MPSSCDRTLHDRHTAVEIGVERQHERTVGDRLHQLRCRHLAARQQDDRRDATGGGVGGERRRRVAGRGAGDGADRPAVLDDLPYNRHEHGHAEVLERSGVGIAAQLHPQVAHPQLASEPLGPEQVRAALVHRDDRFVSDVRAHPFLLAPDRRAIGPGGPLVALVEQPHPRDRRPVGQRVEVVGDLEQVAAGRTAVDRLPQGILPVAAGDTAEHRAIRHLSVIPHVGR